MKNQKLKCIIAALLVLVLIGCATPAKHPALTDASLSDLIPRKDFFVFPESSHSYIVSPDGEKLAWIEQENNYYEVYFKTINEDEVSYLNTSCWCNVSWITWAQDSRHILFSLDLDSNDARHIYAADTLNPDNEPIDLTPNARTGAYF